MRNAFFGTALVFAVACFPVWAQHDCPLRVDALHELDSQELLNAYSGFECESKRMALSVELRKRVQENTLPDNLYQLNADDLELMLGFDVLHEALAKRDLAAGEHALAALELISDKRRLRRLGPTPSDNHDVDEAHQVLEQRLRTIRDIIEGRTPTPAGYRPDPMPDWTLEFGFCGNPALGYYMAATRLIDAEDAWSAVGQDDLAIDQLLATQWVEAIGHGMVPPRLREFGERMLGAAGYAREIEAALAGIRIDSAPTGRVAAIPLLGHWLPLPIATRSWNEEATRRFDDVEALAGWLRPRLTGEDTEVAD